MTNAEISKQFSFLSRLMEVHGENSFKSKSYASAAFNIDKLTYELSAADEVKIKSVSGFGQSTLQKVSELLATGKLKILEDLLEKTPEGIVELMKIKGIGPKKLNVIWKEMEIENAGELLYACKENRLKLFKGFGEKTQNNIAEVLEFFMANKGNYLYASITNLAEEITTLLSGFFTAEKVHITGDYKMQRHVISCLEYVVEEEEEKVKMVLDERAEFEFYRKKEGVLIYKTAAQNFEIKLHVTTAENTLSKLIFTSSSFDFAKALHALSPANKATDEKSYFSVLGLPFITAPLRENAESLKTLTKEQISNIIEQSSIKGLIHCHSKWSDGNNTIKEMAAEAMNKGLDYMLITDHSRSANYAGGLFPEQIVTQHKEIEELNKTLSPFKIFKGIESDILNDGNLDYEPEILNSFDCIIASIHSNLKMEEDKAMKRLLNAIENPYTSILGHVTGRLLISRSGYPVNHKTIIDACAANNVVIELNANPRRLDIDWEHLHYALKKNVLISINPDAHSLAGIKDIQYGIIAARKGMLSAAGNLSSFNLAAFESFIKNQKEKRTN